jgi:hypothetical protein
MAAPTTGVQDISQDPVFQLEQLCKAAGHTTCDLKYLKRANYDAHIGNETLSVYNSLWAAVPNDHPPLMDDTAWSNYIVSVINAIPGGSKHAAVVSHFADTLRSHSNSTTLATIGFLGILITTKYLAEKAGDTTAANKLTAAINDLIGVKSLEFGDTAARLGANRESVDQLGRTYQKVKEGEMALGVVSEEAKHIHQRAKSARRVYYGALGLVLVSLAAQVGALAALGAGLLKTPTTVYGVCGGTAVAAAIFEIVLRV